MIQTITPQKRALKARGAFNSCADVDMIQGEKGAWGRAVVEGWEFYSNSNPSVYLLESDTTKTPVLGRLNGLIEISSDFDEPLEEMKEYMC
ncbi:MAG: DUF2281 domain-containing protein [Defluviitaleaceae bacterium]|nr:DUF2281 domain-containing protein [Defluviitaleaceae bacterium]